MFIYDHKLAVLKAQAKARAEQKARDAASADLQAATIREPIDGWEPEDDDEWEACRKWARESLGPDSRIVTSHRYLAEENERGRITVELVLLLLYVGVLIGFGHAIVTSDLFTVARSPTIEGAYMLTLPHEACASRDDLVSHLACRSGR